MELSTLQIIGIILLVLLFGGVIWRIAKGLFKYLLIALLILVGIYFVKPEILYDWFGKENVEKVERGVNEAAKDAKKEVRETTTDLLDN